MSNTKFRFKYLILSLSKDQPYEAVTKKLRRIAKNRKQVMLFSFVLKHTVLFYGINSMKSS